MRVKIPVAVCPRNDDGLVTVDGIIEQFFPTSKALMLQDGRMSPVLVMFLEMQLHVLSLREFFYDDRSMEQLPIFLRDLGGKPGIEAMALFSECWTIDVPRGEEWRVKEIVDSRRSGETLFGCPYGKESIQAVIETPFDAVRCFAEVFRDETGKVLCIGELKKAESVGNGPLCGFLFGRFAESRVMN